MGGNLVLQQFVKLDSSLNRAGRSEFKSQFRHKAPQAGQSGLLLRVVVECQCGT